jgi:hypothetical protein
MPPPLHLIPYEFGLLGAVLAPVSWEKILFVLKGRA